MKTSAALLVLALEGCAAFRTGGRAAGPWPVAGSVAAKSSISVLVGYHCVQDHAPSELGQIDTTSIGAATGEWILLWRIEALRAFQESGMYGTVTSGAGDTDLRAEVEVTQEGRIYALTSFLCGFTFLTLPEISTMHYRVRTRILDRAGAVVSDTTAMTSLVGFMTWLMLPAMPFAHPDAVQRGMVCEAVRMTLQPR